MNLLSKTINIHADKNFNDYINGYRIEAFKLNVVAPDANRFSLLAHAQESGFNSKATFYRAFKKAEGMSPSVYLSNITSR